MNAQEEQIFWELLRYSLFRTPMHPEKWTSTWSWKAIMQNLQAQSLETIVSDAIMGLPSEVRPEAKDILHINQLIGANMRQHLQLNQDLAVIFEHLKENGLHPVLLKGQGNATYYSNPLLRMTGDLDIYVGKADYEKGCQLLREFIHSDKAIAEAHETPKHYSISYGKTEIELHRIAEQLSNSSQNKAFEDLWTYWLGHPQTVQIGEAEIQIPPKEFNALFVFSHLWHHFILNGVGFRQFCDLAMILHKDHSFIERQLKTDLQQIGLHKAWQMVGNILVDYMGLPEEEFPLYSKSYDKQAKMMIKLILKEGNFGWLHPYGNKKDCFVKRKYDSVVRWLERFVDLLPIAPTASLRILGYLLKGGHGLK